MKLVNQLVRLVGDDEDVRLLQGLNNLHELFGAGRVQRRIKDFIEHKHIARRAVLDTGHRTPCQQQRQVDALLLPFTERVIRKVFTMPRLHVLRELFVQREVNRKVHRRQIVVDLLVDDR